MPIVLDPNCVICGEPRDSSVIPQLIAEYFEPHLQDLHDELLRNVPCTPCQLSGEDGIVVALATLSDSSPEKVDQATAENLFSIVGSTTYPDELIPTVVVDKMVNFLYQRRNEIDLLGIVTCMLTHMSYQGKGFVTSFLRRVAQHALSSNEKELDKFEPNIGFNRVESTVRISQRTSRLKIVEEVEEIYEELDKRLDVAKFHRDFEHIYH
ncbi:uncharacterized protein F4822DRAFT_111633 [Hypoxylon trugodes]|uniref:uncharacterized protein n=1 Tax=Hypoxylon trugodes TaxID=326681 RepID=UPI00219F831D|nr:uncharacterized protein F4822DRAFT_111633 [Hypoxylon trugodes]KAI1391990.1 hypothetical protein F4822DRAFT_111633 [Hypoxylon trugodes]